VLARAGPPAGAVLLTVGPVSRRGAVGPLVVPHLGDQCYPLGGVLTGNRFPGPAIGILIRSGTDLGAVAEILGHACPPIADWGLSEMTRLREIHHPRANTNHPPSSPHNPTRSTNDSRDGNQTRSIALRCGRSLLSSRPTDGHNQRLLSAPVTVDPDIPRRVAQVRHDIEDLYALQTTANDALNTLNGQQRRLTNRVDEVQQTLDLYGGRFDRIENNQRRQSEQLADLSDQLAEALKVLRGLGPSD